LISPRAYKGGEEIEHANTACALTPRSSAPETNDGRSRAGEVGI